MLVRGVDERLKILIPDVANERRVAVIELEVMPDPVHLLCEVDLQFGIHKFIKQVKGRSSRAWGFYLGSVNLIFCDPLRFPHVMVSYPLTAVVRCEEIGSLSRRLKYEG